jgi:hypothetical protein
MVFYFSKNNGLSMKKGGQQDGHMHTDTTENNNINSSSITMPHGEGFIDKHGILLTWETTRGWTWQ